ncbi:MAG: hypothetical protein PHV02_19570 [Rhodocyclaceae bacterium]|nr:hypothetical protein [Rhodocyclaceae bacterium]
MIDDLSMKKCFVGAIILGNWLLSAICGGAETYLSPTNSDGRVVGHTITYAEDRGPKLQNMNVDSLVKLLSQSKDRAELRKAARVLGDCSMKPDFNISPSIQSALGLIVTNYLQQVASKDSNQRIEARAQIERLWYVAAPVLLENVANREPAIAETAIKSLILMRNETIIRGLIMQAKSARDPQVRTIILFTLGKMKEKRRSIVSNRSCLDEKETNRLCDALVQPFLEQK